MIPQETLDWLVSVGATKFAQPMMFHADCGKMLYSEQYLAETPLEVLKAGWYDRVTNQPVESQLRYVHTGHCDCYPPGTCKPQWVDPIDYVVGEPKEDPYNV